MLVLRSLVCFLLGVLMSTCALAREGGVVEGRIIARSSTRRTILMNVGQLDLVRSGDFVVLIRKIHYELDDSNRLVAVAKGRVVQASRNRSIIMLYRVEDLKQIVPNEGYIVAVESVMMKGRRLIENDRLRQVEEQKDLIINLNEKQRGSINSLTRKDGYRVGQKNHELGEVYHKDGTLTDVDQWVTLGRDKKEKFARALWRSPYEKDFAIQKRLETFDKLVSAYLARVNDKNFNYDTFYEEQMRDTQGNINERTSAITDYEEFLQKRRDTEEREAELFREMLAKGEGWSDDYSDEELGHRLENVGFVVEQERRQTAYTANRFFQGTGALGLNLLDNANRADPDGSRKLRWNAELGLEIYPSRYNEVMRQVGLWANGRYMQDSVSVGKKNAYLNDRSFSLGFNYHFREVPSAVNRNIPFLGLGVRTGVSTLKIPTTREQGSYSLLSFPVLQGGVKYNFRSGWGLRVVGSVEKFLLEQTNSNVTGGQLPRRTDFLDGRLTFGVGRFF